MRSTLSINMLLTDSDSYHQLKLTDLLNLKCDLCSNNYQKTKMSWYYSAYKKGIGLNFKIKTYCSSQCHKTRSKKQYTCLECNKEFTGSIREVQKFCNHSCSAKFNNRLRDSSKFVNCLDCNVQFSVWKSKTQKSFRCKNCIKLINKTIKTVKPKIKLCKVCLKDCPSKGNSLYCSSYCKKLNKKLHKHICTRCNTNFLNIEKKSKYCSHSCRSIHLKLSSYAHKAGGKSRSQIELLIEENLIKDFPGMQFKFNDKEVIGSELDVYIPELRIAIEINGIVHYEPIYGEDTLRKTQNRDKQKMINCYELGIELIVIPLGRRGLSKKQTEEIYQEISNIIRRNQNRKNSVSEKI